MFFQIFLIAAGIHLGRTLTKEWDELPHRRRAEPEPGPEPGPEPEPDALPQAGADLHAAEAARAEADTEADTEAGEREEVKEGTDRGPGAADGARAYPQAALAAADAAAQDQLDVAMVSTALTVMPATQNVGGLGLLYGGLHKLKLAVKFLLLGRIGLELLESVNLLATMATRRFFFSSFTFLLTSVADKIRTRTELDAHRNLQELFEQRPHEAWVLRDGVEVSAALGELCEGDVVVVTAGSQIPVDGIVIEGGARIDQHILTGSAQVVEVTVGDQVFSQTVALSGRLLARVVASGQQTAAAAVARTLQHTADFAITVERQAKRLSDDTAVPILALSAVAAPWLGAEGVLALLSVNTIDNMRMVAPYSMLNALRTAYQQGILLKDGRALQRLSQVDTVVFSKTGTLTMAQLQVHAVHPVRGVGQDELLRCAAAAEARQAHPIARAVVEEARRRGIAVPARDDVRLEPGHGLSAGQDAKRVRIGSRQFLELHGLRVPAALLREETAIHKEGRSVIYVARGRSLLGLVELQPVLRPEIAHVLQALRQRGRRLHLLSGDHEEPTRALAAQLAIEDYAAQVLPDDKARIVRELQRSGRRVCFVGDGLSDTQVLRQAEVSVSMRGAATVATDSAQIVLMDGGLHKLPQLFALAERSARTMDHLFLAAALPAVVSLGGVCLGGFTQQTVQQIHLASMVLSGAIASQTAPGSKDAESQLCQ